eukprot:CAMPEP_0196664416 /NCGR_PEP_ID=MMETSP1086-20130531/57088_1 /TAXON_ID=77921 /ORGANISM="Cyanoptyche  gloeocystis , Strain SAG4.97" /LENGTH=128 /DNA_ID=CAMNT_0042000709 /DNA_START=47 /DNA_END=430 /DNA_ORIENTATION=-
MVSIGIGKKLPAKWRDGKYYDSEILDKRHREESSGEWEYYVHYTDFNRRMDEWVTEDRLDTSHLLPEPSPAPPVQDSDVAIESKPLSERKLTRNMKRRFEETTLDKNAEEFGDPHLSALEKEHDDATK